MTASREASEAYENPSTATLLSGIVLLAGAGIAVWWWMSNDMSSQLRIFGAPKPALSRLSDELWSQIQTVANNIGADPEHLALVMNFESGFDPRAVNPRSGASGLIQFMTFTANNLGTTVENIRQMAASEQMPLVEEYFRRNAGGRPLNSLQAVAMAVFYPKFMNVDENTEFPANVQASNPGIRTPADYVRKVLSHAR